MATFVDRVVVHATAGDGGHGCASIHREKFKPLGGPDGGNGGNGGSIVAVADSNVRSLVELHRSPHRRADNGRPGQGGHRSGANGTDIELRVPIGTVIKDTNDQVVADLVRPGARHVIAAGGRGGLGNAALASPRRKAPGFALLGEPGDDVTIVAELKTIADVGLVGYPSAGKSSLIARMSSARPKIADYPFTTLIPNLGVVRAGSEVFTMADVPGLIPGASQGKGLGHEFLRHIERCHVLVHVVDCATLEPGRDPVSDLEVIEAELAARGGLQDRPRFVVLNKVDIPEAAELATFVERDITDRWSWPTFVVSSVTGEGVDRLGHALAAAVASLRPVDTDEPELVENIRITPAPVDGPEFSVTVEGDTYRVRGAKPTRWVRQTDFSNDEAVGFLADRLARLGVEDELARLGATPGATVVIGPEHDAVVFDWHPSIAAGDLDASGPRGTDVRFDEGR